MGIGSLFIVNNKTESLCALKHWGPTVAHTPVVEKVFAAHRNSVKNNLYSDVLATEGKQYIFHITRGEITYVATTETETEPLMVVEFLTQLHTVLKAYFGEVTETVLQVRHPASCCCCGGGGAGVPRRSQSLPRTIKTRAATKALGSTPQPFFTLRPKDRIQPSPLPPHPSFSP
jgi:hypothetical protein